ncbi:MAG: WD40 repeat domain-containing protein [Gaiellaceae bacterium]
MTETIVEPAGIASPAPPPSPYKGLVPYAESDADFFFGREHEREVIAGNLLAARLTLFYGPTGVGKSSVLLAGVVDDLRTRARENLENDAPGFAVVVVRAWRDDPLETIAGAVRAAVVELLGRDDLPDPPPGAPLAGVLGHWSEQLKAKLLVVFDQFEEYFLYHEHDHGPDSFDAQFPLAVNQPALRANFLISMREDALARLDRFKGRIPNLFDNRLQIDHLTLEAARDAVMLPIEELNRRVAPGERMTIEGELVDDVLAQVRTGRVSLGSVGLGTVDGGEAAGTRVEAPFLQVVLTALWQAETEQGSRTLRAQTLRALGGAETLARNRLDERVGRLAPAEQDIAAEVFQFLVTRSGTKIAHTAEDLAEFAELRVEQVEPVLERLAGDARILRTLPPPRNAGASRYEIFHDVLGPAILDWRARYMEAQRRAATEAQARRARRRARLSYGIATLSFLVAAGVAVLSYVALQERKSARAQRYVAEAASLLATDPYRSVKLAEQALETKSTPAAESAFRVAVSQSRLRLVAVHGTAVHSAAYSHDGTLVLSVGGKGARVWDASTGRSVDVIEYGRASRLSGQLSGARFVPTGHGVLTAGWDGTVRLWTPPSWRGKIVARGAPALSSAELNRDGSRVLVLDGDGRVQLVPLVPLALKFLNQEQSRGAVPALPRSGIDVAAFSPDGRFVVTGSDRGVIQFRDGSTGRLLHSVRAQHGAITTLSFDRDGGLLVTGSDDMTARVWRVPSGAPVGRPLHEERPLNVATLSPSGTLVATAADKVVHLWDVATGMDVGALRGHGDWVNDAEFSPDGTLVVTASGDATARVWDLATRGELFALRGSGSVVNTAQFSPNGTTVVTASADGTARVWDVTTGKTLRRHRDWVLDAAFTPDGRQIFTAGADRELMVWNAATGNYVTALGIPPKKPVTGIAFDPVSGHHRFVMAIADGTAVVRDSRTGKRVTTIDEAKRTGLTGDDAALNSAAFSPDGQRIVTASSDWTASIWNARTGRHIATLVKPKWNGLSFTHSGAVADAAYSPGGRYIVTVGTDRLARVWTAAGTPTPIVFSRHHGNVLRVVFDPKDSSLVATTGDDESVRVWDVRNGKQLAVLDAGVPLGGVAFSPNGDLLAAVSADGFTRVWDWRREELLAAPKMHADLVNSVAFSPDGHWILTASDDRTAKLYPCYTCGPLKALEDRVHKGEQQLATIDKSGN